MRTQLYRLSLVFAVTVLCLSALAQTQAEKDILKAADKRFESQKFLEALPDFRQLVSISPRNKDYNFKYGTCLLYSDEDVEQAVNHLSFACRGGNFEDKRAYFYLGKAYHLNYQFADALKSYRDFKEKVDTKTGSSFREVDRLITMAENGKRLLSDIKDIKVLDKTESTVGEFFRNYDLSDMGGSIIKVPVELLSTVDKKKGHSPLMYFPAEGGLEIIFSSYGKADQLDLYSVRRTSSGGFTAPEKLQGVVNSPFDEDFPFLHADGRTLYFSSKGHNSMGGYDIFKSNRNLSTGLFESPENLDFAISTPDDDIFYVVDKEKRIAHFASTRNSEDGRLHVYQVAVRSAPIELAIVKGSLVNSKGGSADAQIKVLDANTNEELGVYRTDDNGDYLIDLPGAGKYKFFIDASDSEITHTGFVDVPSFGRMKAFVQEMELKEESNQEKLVIMNNFDEEPSGDVVLLAQEILKRKAQLDVNYDGLVEAEDSDAITEDLSPEDILIRSGYAQGTSMESVMETAYQQAEKLSDRIERESSERDKAYARAMRISELADARMKEADDLYKQVQSEGDPVKKSELMLETSIKRLEAEQLTEQAEIALQLTEELEEVTTENSSTKASLLERNSSIESALENSDNEKLIASLTAVKKADDEGLAEVDALDITTKRSLELNAESQGMLGRVEKIREDRNSVAASIKTKENVLSRTSKQREKDILEAELLALRSELESLDSQLEKNSSKLIDIQRSSDISTGSVTLLEKIRMGEDPELKELQPLSIPSGGLVQANDRLAGIRAIGEGIAISEEELAQIVSKNPSLLDGLDTEQRELLGAKISIGDLPIASSSSVDSSSSSDDFNDSDTSVSTTEDTTSDRAIETRSEDIGQNESGSTADSSSSIEDETVDSNIASSSSEDLNTSTPDFSQMSLDDLLNELQADYTRARSDIESSDMNPVDKAQAKIDLNRASIQNIEQDILLTKYKEGYSDNSVEQANVQKMEELIEELREEMLFIAKESEISDETVADAEESVVTSSNTLDRIAAQTGLSEELDSHYSEIARINSDTSASSIVQLSARMNEHLSFVDMARQAQSEAKASSLDADKNRVSAIEELLQTKREEIDRDIAEWKNESGIELSPEEEILARNSPTYITQRSLIEATVNAESRSQLNDRTAEAILSKNNSFSDFEGDPLLSSTEMVAFLESTSSESTALESSENGIQDLTDNEEELGSTQNADISFLAESKDWSTELFDNNRSKSVGMQVQKEMTTRYPLFENEVDRMEAEVEMVNRLRAPIDEEMLWKEEVMKLAIKKDDVFPEVTALMEESYSLDAAATSLRSSSNSDLELSEKNDALNKALLLELSSLDRFNEALAMQKHLAKGKDITGFRYANAIVIDNGLLQDPAVAEYLNPAVESEELSSSSELVDSRTAEVDTQEEEETSELRAEIQDAADTESEEIQVPESTEDLTAEIQTELDPREDEVDVDNEEVISEEEASDEAKNSANIPQEELARAPDLGSREDIAAMDIMSSSAAIQAYPKVSSELTSLDIVPVLTYEEEINMRDAEVSYFSFLEDDRSMSLNTEETEAMESKEIELIKAKAYQKELQQLISDYQAHSVIRKTQLAEVINIINENGGSQDLNNEKAKLTAEVQIIESYIDQARTNQFEISQSVNNLMVGREELLSQAEERSQAAAEAERIAAAESVEETEPDVLVPSEVLEEVEEPAVVLEEVEEPTEVAEVVEPSYDSYGIPDILTEDIFSVSEQASDREIPINIDLPDGVIYQVQVGAFRNPIPEYLFKEFNPIMGERLESGITRYKVGLFIDRETATTARDQIRGLGYDDAFVVRYEDGKRGGVSQTLASATQSSSSSREESTPAISAANTEESSSSRNTTATDERNTEPEIKVVPQFDPENPTAYYDAFVSAAPATQVEIVDGLFYTVQVGVYSKPVTSSSIFGISPLNSELLTNGLIKYTSGIFDDVTVAEQWKESIRSKGVADAFITAYHNGKRITLNQASSLLANRGDQVLADLTEMDDLHTDRQGQAVWEMVSTSELFADEVREQIQFKIRMGPYFDRIPDKDVKVILDFENNVDYGRRDDGAIIYTTKGSMTYEEAQKWRTTFLESGITNANIIALQGGNEISVKQALDFLLK